MNVWGQWDRSLISIRLASGMWGWSPTSPISMKLGRKVQRGPLKNPISYGVNPKSWGGSTFVFGGRLRSTIWYIFTTHRCNSEAIASVEIRWHSRVWNISRHMTWLQLEIWVPSVRLVSGWWGRYSLIIEVGQAGFRSVSLIFEIYGFGLGSVIFEICEADVRSVRQVSENGLWGLWHWSQVTGVDVTLMTDSDLSSVRLISKNSEINISSGRSEVCETV